MHSDEILRGLSTASYLLTAVIFAFLYMEILTPWTFFAMFVTIWFILAAVVMQRSAKHAERELAQKLFQMFGEASQKSKEAQEILTKMKSKFPFGETPVN